MHTRPQRNLTLAHFQRQSRYKMVHVRCFLSQIASNFTIIKCITRSRRIHNAKCHFVTHIYINRFYFFLIYRFILQLVCFAQCTHSSALQYRMQCKKSATPLNVNQKRKKMASNTYSTTLDAIHVFVQ